jgi:hypothetical protein
MIKISAKYWNTLHKFEQQYIECRAHIDGLTSLKLRIKEARKQYPAFVKIYGKGFIELDSGETFVWSGDDTRKYVKVIRVEDRPLAADGMISYRAKGRYGYIMIGAKDFADAMAQAKRSTDNPIDLEVWDGEKYIPVI